MYEYFYKYICSDEATLPISINQSCKDGLPGVFPLNKTIPIMITVKIKSDAQWATCRASPNTYSLDSKSKLS